MEQWLPKSVLCLRNYTLQDFLADLAAGITAEVTDDYVEAGRAHILQDKDIPDYVRVFRIHGPFLFGATDKLDLLSEQLDDLPPVVIVRLRNMTAIDTTGLKVLEDLAEKLHDSGCALLFCGAPPQPRQLMKQAAFDRHVGAENLCPSIEAALRRGAECMKEIQMGQARSQTEGS